MLSLMLGTSRRRGDSWRWTQEGVANHASAMTAYFVTGTDTNVGKTTLACALLAAAARAGLRGIGMKPAESGCPSSATGELIPIDAEALRKVSSIPLPLSQTCLYRFAEPLAPGVAADRNHTIIDVDLIGQAFARIQALSPDLLLVEGAGGLLVPFGDGILAVDIAQRLELPLIIVARPDLGTINHTLLTLEAAASRGLTIAGLAFSCTRPDIATDFIASNISEIRKIRWVPFLGVLPVVEPLETNTLATAGEPLLRTLLDPHRLQRS